MVPNLSALPKISWKNKLAYAILILHVFQAMQCNY